MDIDVQNADASQSHVLDTVEGEIHFFRSLMRARPVGMHRYFHVIAMQSAIEKGTKTLVSIDDIWRKLESCYNLEALEALVRQYHSMLLSFDVLTIRNHRRQNMKRTVHLTQHLNHPRHLNQRTTLRRTLSSETSSRYP